MYWICHDRARAFRTRLPTPSISDWRRRPLEGCCENLDRTVRRGEAACRPPRKTQMEEGAYRHGGRRLQNGGLDGDGEEGRRRRERELHQDAPEQSRRGRSLLLAGLDDRRRKEPCRPIRLGSTTSRVLPPTTARAHLLPRAASRSTTTCEGYKASTATTADSTR